MSWFILMAAIVCEVIGTTCMKLSEGFTKLVPVICMFLFYLSSLAALSLTLRSIEVGIAYAVWSGVGTALIALIGIIFFHEGITALKIGGILLVISGAVILNLASTHP
jgi:small multidrug resistance pump